jgi:ethanolamine utilization protein EutA
LKHYHPDPDHTPEGHADEVERDDGVALATNPLWQRDNVVLVSVGIDVGSAGTQVLFSRMQLQRQGLDLCSRYLVVERETLFESPVSLTPYLGESLIDARKLGEIVDAAYNAARLHPDQIDTGVVLLTGEALRRENAEPIARVLAEKCGDLVCAAAGHHMEATLAAQGSGAVQWSYEQRQCVLNVDMGGGTVKLSVIDRGRILSTAALQIGARLVAVDDDGMIERLDPAGRAHAERAGLEWRRGKRVTTAELALVAEAMADDLVAALVLTDPGRDVLELYLTDPIRDLDRVESVLCSGGVAEYVYGRESRAFGDLGMQLGSALRARFEAGTLPWPLLAGSRGIRSTALGCSEFTAQLSGNTLYISAPEALLPRRNMKVLSPPLQLEGEIVSGEVAAAIRRHLVLCEIDSTDERLVLALHWRGPPRYRRLRALAEGIVAGLAERAAAGLPLYVILDADIALGLGAILHRELGLPGEVLVIDGLALWDFDAVDIGRLRQPSATVPVTIKSLVFHDVVHAARRRELVQGVSRPLAATA